MPKEDFEIWEENLTVKEVRRGEYVVQWQEDRLGWSLPAT